VSPAVTEKKKFNEHAKERGKVFEVHPAPLGKKRENRPQFPGEKKKKGGKGLSPLPPQTNREEKTGFVSA